MRKILSALLAIVVVMLALFTGFSVTGLALDGDATAIKTEAEFLAMDADGSYFLDSDITLTKSYDKVFTGRFDGNGKTVTVTAGALFKKVENADISNFTVEGDITVSGKGYSFDGNDFASAVAIVANGKASFNNIVSNVNFKTTSSNTRYGAIVATSDEYYDITIENCINNGNISVVKYAGGIYGWNAKVGDISVKNCLNNGTISAGGYCAGILCRASDSSSDIHVSIENCVNTADISSSEEYCAGIYSYGKTFVKVLNCVNFGNVNAASGHTGGIAANLANPGSNGGAHIFRGNINYGNIKNGTETAHVGGIIGYVYGKEQGYAIVDGNINFGTVTGAGYCSQIIAYTNSTMTQITNNIGAGRVVGADPNKAVMVGLSSADITKYTVSGNCFLENDGTKTYSYANDDKNQANRIALDARPEGALTFISPEMLSDGTVAELLNEALLDNAFEVRDGFTLPICRHEYHVIDGKCIVCKAEIVFETEEETTAEDTSAETSEPSEETTTEEIKEKGCNDSAGLGAVAAILAIVCGAAAITIKKKA